MTSHTPGPWRWVGPYLDSSDLVSDHGAVMTFMAYEGISFDGPNDAVDQANARLIAAAPDMLRVLQRIHANGYAGMDDWHMVRDVIAQATGVIAND